MFYVIQDSDGPFIVQDKAIMEPGDKLLLETSDFETARDRVDRAVAEWCKDVKDDGPEEFWRDYSNKESE